MWQENLEFYERVRLLCACYGYQVVLPGRPLLFMGGLEAAQKNELVTSCQGTSKENVFQKTPGCITTGNPTQKVVNSKGMLPKMALIQIKDLLVNCP